MAVGPPGFGRRPRALLKARSGARARVRANGGAGSLLFVLFVPFEADSSAPKRTEADEADVFSGWLVSAGPLNRSH